MIGNIESLGNHSSDDHLLLCSMTSQVNVLLMSLIIILHAHLHVYCMFSCISYLGGVFLFACKHVFYLCFARGDLHPDERIRTSL